MMLRAPALALPARASASRGRGRVSRAAAPARVVRASSADADADREKNISRDVAAPAPLSADATRNVLAAFPALAMLASPEIASAAVSPVASATAAYGHYLGLVLVVATLVAEKFLIKPELTEEEAKTLVIADSVYGIAGLLVLYTGYLRVTEYGKGWEFYAHEPIFWVKMGLFGVMGSSSLFNTIKIITMAAAQSKGEKPALGEKLAARMQKIVNGELLAIGSIPLAAAMMARGVAYQEQMPWQAGAAPVAAVCAGLTFKYVKEALSWSDEEKVESA